jgi:hypothetical protein
VSCTRDFSRFNRKHFSIDDGVLDAITKNSLAEQLRVEPLCVLTVRVQADSHSQMSLGDQEHGRDSDVVRAKGGLEAAKGEAIEIRYGLLSIRRRHDGLKQKRC